MWFILGIIDILENLHGIFNNFRITLRTPNLH